MWTCEQTAVIGLRREFIDFAHCVCTYTTLAYLRVRYVAFHARVLPCIQLHKVVVRTLSTWPIDGFEDREKEGPFEVIWWRAMLLLRGLEMRTSHPSNSSPLSCTPCVNAQRKENCPKTSLWDAVPFWAKWYLRQNQQLNGFSLMILKNEIRVLRRSLSVKELRQFTGFNSMRRLLLR